MSKCSTLNDKSKEARSRRLLAGWPVGTTNTDIWPNSITNSWREREREKERDRMAGNKDEGGERQL